MSFGSTIEYLRRGSAPQPEVYALLQELRIMEHLADYSPLLVGTVPLGLEVEGSDLDIVCEVHEPEAFILAAGRFFGGQGGFSAVTRPVAGIPRTVIRFSAGGWPIELFGQPVPSARQNGYLHMLAEWRILRQLGPEFREAVIRLKRAGVKTEPAFARLLRLEGDPYEALLHAGRLNDGELAELCGRISGQMHVSDGLGPTLAIDNKECR
ncbi:DUF4269 domain-containing protein [Paenibacillus sp. NFR01]|uniref:DUF4269 domain-containing protein n=1 Tax=Paenibacillus sp. NFR01 TaxID=1566279 RepID=UPI0008AED432|nr:DUF4269 domain-containing protein [Paenibacillus sp. NFR01]SEU24230.1 protein of unknown function [Paenibacillus sp. NFR01]